jgi:hypothetical protein
MNGHGIVAMVLPPTDPALADADTRPYFLWWTEATVGEFRQRLASSDPTERAYWMGALLREANTRDVWLFVTPRQIRDAWPSLLRHLGRRRELWGFLLDLDPTWPPPARTIRP